MASNWVKTTLSDVIKTNQFNYSKNDNWEFVHYLDTGNITENNISVIQYLEVGKDKIPSRAKRKVVDGDIIYSTVRPDQKHYGIINNPPENLLVSTGFTTINCNAELADNNFIYWFLTQDYITNHLHRIGEQSASTYPSIKPSDIEALEVKLPSLSEQKAIAYILDKLGEKIELNRQMNETLEAMAQALFKSWFVDFDPVIDNALLAGNAIPEPLKERAEMRQAQLDSGKANTNSELNELFPSEFELIAAKGWIPKGWNVCNFKDIVEKYIDNRGKTPPLSESGIPLIEVKHIEDNSLKPSLDTNKYVDRETYNTWFRAHLETDDIIISTVGTIGRICIVSKGDEFCIAQNLLGFRFDQEKALTSFMYYQMDSYVFKHDVDARLVTTVQASIKRKDLETIPLLLPDMKIQKAFNKTVAPLMKKQNFNSNINLSLAQLRDTLLPKLMSGELRIADAEKLVQEM